MPSHSNTTENPSQDKKSLNKKAVNIKGKQYVLVADRIVYFNENFPDGSIETNLITDPGSDRIIIKATVYPDNEKKRVFAAYSQATIGDGYINKTSALENCETSAVGRALAFMGIGVIESVASVDEIKKASFPVSPVKIGVQPPQKPVEPPKPTQEFGTQKVEKPAVDPDKAKIKELADTLDPLMNTADEYKAFCKLKTGFELKPENYKMIIKSLERLVDGKEKETDKQVEELAKTFDGEVIK